MINAQRFTRRDDGGSPRRPLHGRSRGLFRDDVRTRGLHRDDGGSLHRRDGERIHGLRCGDARTRDLPLDDVHGGRTSCVERVSFQLIPFFRARQKFVFETSRSSIMALPEFYFGHTKRTVQSIPHFLNLSYPTV